LSADFLNLGQNARLIIPTKKSEEEIYNHFSRFLRYAGNNQKVALFNRVGCKIRDEIKLQKSIWLSTAGAGVIWLHVRMDTRPKYFKTTMYISRDYWL